MSMTSRQAPRWSGGYRPGYGGRRRRLIAHQHPQREPHYDPQWRALGRQRERARFDHDPLGHRDTIRRRHAAERDGRSVRPVWRRHVGGRPARSRRQRQHAEPAEFRRWSGGAGQGAAVVRSVRRPERRRSVRRPSSKPSHAMLADAAGPRSERAAAAADGGWRSATAGLAARAVVVNLSAATREVSPTRRGRPWTKSLGR